MVEFLCTLMGVAAGVAIVASLLPKYGDRQKFASLQKTTDADRILGIADQLHLISHRVAADVCAHSERVGSISDRMATPGAIPEQVLATITEILEANKAMQGQLVDAQMRIAQQSRTIEQTSHQARTDALTGVSNRRALNEFVTNSIQQLTADSFTGLMLLDIDHFKEFNDNFGHTTGDAVLASFARSISDYCGGACYVARYGGEEFAVVLTGSSLDETVAKAAALRHYVSEQTINYQDLQLNVTASAGLCMLLVDDACQAVYDRADKGLYQAKKSGRSCGFWLSSDGWSPFPDLTDAPPKLADLKCPPATKNSAIPAVAQPGLPSADSPSPGARGAEVDDSAPTSPVNDSPAITDVPLQSEPSVELSDEVLSQPDSAAEAKAAAGQQLEVLDLNAFLGRLDSFVRQLRKAELPGTGFMLEAIGLRQGNPSQAAACWSKTVQLVVQNLRGIDVPCLYRPYTLCVFLPSCSFDAGVARAAKIKRILLDASGQWNGAGVCEKLAVCVASVGVAEENANFLNRLELALETAADSSLAEVVTHDGNTCHFIEA